MAIPNGSDTIVAHAAMRSDSLTATHSSGVRSRSVIGWSRGGLDQEGEAVALERGLRFSRAQEGEVAPDIRLRRDGRRHRIHDRRMRVLGEPADDLHVRFDPGVSLVDDAQWRL